MQSIVGASAFEKANFEMRFAIVFGALLAVAVATSQIGFVDDVQSGVAQLVNSADPYIDRVLQKYASEGQGAVDRAAALGRGVNSTVESVLADVDYTIRSMYDGTVDLDDYDINGVRGVVLTDEGHLAGKPYLVTEVLFQHIAAVIGDVFNPSPENAGRDYDPWTHLLCYWNSWENAEGNIISDAIDLLKSVGMECDDRANGAPPAVATVETSSGTYMSLDSLKYLACLLDINRSLPHNMFGEFSANIGDLRCYRYFQDTT